MMAVHEFGHVVGALVTGGTVTSVVVHPLAISRTDVAPNPYPAIVVWLGPIVGCVLPLLLLQVCRRLKLLDVWLQLLRFFCGFCLVANGAYILFGSFDQVGDCRQMLQTGSPLWLLIAFGVVTLSCGFVIWHRLGTLHSFWTNPTAVPQEMLSSMLIICAMAVFFCVLLSGS